MHIPEKKIEEFTLELINRCLSSKKERMNAGALWKQYYYNGTNQPAQSPYNRCMVHIDRASSYLFSPSDVNFRLHSGIGDSERNVPKDWQEAWFAKKNKTPLKWPNWQEMRHLSAHYLNSEFYRCGVQETISQALDWAMIKNSAFVKILWSNDGFDSYVVQPEQMGVLREDITGLHRQEAFVHTTFITFSQFLQKIKNHPEEEKMIEKVRRRASKSRAGEQFENQFLHSMIIGGLATQANPSGNIKGSAQIFGGPTPILSPYVQNNLLVCHEVWVKDDDKEDWTTIQLIEPDIIIEGKLRHRNLTGIKGETGFKQICVNPTDGYFFGISELLPLRPLQDMINTRVSQINRVLRRRSRPSKAISGFSGDAAQAKKALDSADGLLIEGQGQALKIDNMSPDAPSDMFESLRETINMFDEVAGFTPVMRGEGESGVRSAAHGETLVRTSSPRMRDKALIVERQCGDIGDFCFKLLQAKETKTFTTFEGEEFLLSQLPDDTKVMVDSHSSSPAFSEDIRGMAYNLAKLGAISHADLIEMVHPPGESELAQKARDRDRQQAELLQQHPELLLKGKKK